MVLKTLDAMGPMHSYGIALLLASLGVYAVVAYGVSRRKREFGIRLALGASPGEVQRAVLGDTLRLAAVGLVLGLPAPGWCPA